MEWKITKFTPNQSYRKVAITHYMPPHWTKHGQLYIHEEGGKFYVCHAQFSQQLAVCETLELAKVTCLLSR